MQNAMEFVEKLLSNKSFKKRLKEENPQLAWLLCDDTNQNWDSRDILVWIIKEYQKKELGIV